MKYAILDVHNIFRIRAQNKNTLCNGIPVGGVVGIAQMIELLRGNEYYVIAALEGRDSTVARKRILPEYKQTRGSKGKRALMVSQHENDNNIQWQWRATLPLLELMRVPLAFARGKEADDIISALCFHLLHDEETEQINIISNDSDFYQLSCSDDRVVQTSPTNTSTPITYNSIREKLGFDPYNIVWYKCLAGDRADNIPGIVGIGDKKAKEILRNTTKMAQVQDLFDFLDQNSISLATKNVSDAQAREAIKLLFKVCTLHHDYVLKDLRMQIALPDAATQQSEIAKWYRKFLITVPSRCYNYATQFNDFRNEFDNFVNPMPYSWHEPKLVQD